MGAFCSLVKVLFRGFSPFSSIFSIFFLLYILRIVIDGAIMHWLLNKPLKQQGFCLCCSEPIMPIGR